MQHANTEPLTGSATPAPGDRARETPPGGPAWATRLGDVLESVARFPEPRRRWQRYAFAIASMTIAVVITIGVDVAIGANTIGLLIAAVVLSIWFGGLRAGIVAMVSGVVATWTAIAEPRFTRGFDDAERWLLSGGFVAISALIGMLYLAARDALRRADALAARTRELAEQRETLLADVSASEQRWHALADAIPILIGQGTPDGRITFVNRAWSQYTGIPHRQILEGRFNDAVHPEDRRHLAGVIARALAERRMAEVEYRLSNADGQYRWQLGIAQPIMQANGEVAYWIGLAVDIEDRKRAEQVLRESEERYRSLGEALPAHVVVMDASGTFEYCNRSYLEYVGLTIEQANRWQEYQLVHPEDYDAAMARWTRSLSTGEPLRSEMRIRRQDGAYRWFLVQGFPVRDAGGTILRWVTASVDIHDRKIVEEALTASERDLHEAIAAKDEFLGLVSHELKTPITTILGNAYVLERRGKLIDEESRQQALLDIHHEAERLHRIIDNLLVLARLERGQEPEVEPLILDRIVDAAADEHRHQFPRRRIDVTVIGKHMPVSGSPVYLEQVLRNLLSNAEKYSPVQEPIEITLTYAGDEICLSVADRGPGISEDERIAIFSSFYRSPRTSRRVQGIGVGLAVCKRLVEAQGGSIAVHRREGGGSAFDVRLPAAVDEDQSDVAAPGAIA